MHWLAKTLLVPGLLALAACGFEPLHAQRANGGSIDNQMAQVKIESIQDNPELLQPRPAGVGRVDIARLGQELRNELLDSMTPQGRPQNPIYVLHVDLQESDSPIAIDQAGNSQRSTIQIVANYSLRSAADQANLLSGTTTYQNSYAITLNSYSTVVGRSDAEKRAMRGIAEDITRRVALYFSRISRQ